MDSRSDSSVSESSIKNKIDHGACSISSMIFSQFYLSIFYFPDEGGPRRSTRADYETAIAATGIII